MRGNAILIASNLIIWNSYESKLIFTYNFDEAEVSVNRLIDESILPLLIFPLSAIESFVTCGKGN
jgi:hypothetical protein